MTAGAVVFVDELGVASLIRVLLLGAPVGTIWHFQPLSRPMERWLRATAKLGWLRADVRQVAHQIGEVRDSGGGSCYTRATAQAQAMAEAITRERLATHPLVAALRPVWRTDRVVFYLAKVAEQALIQECLRIELVSWMLRTVVQAPSASGVLILRKTPWLQTLVRHGRAHGLRVVGYPSMKLSPVIRAARALLRSCQGALRSLWSRPLASGTRAAQGPNGHARPAIAVRYWFRNLSLKPVDRSEFFWLSDSLRRDADILLYCHVPLPVDVSTRRQLAAQGIRVLPDPPRTTMRAAGIFAGVGGRLLRHGAACLIRRQPMSWHLMRLLARLAYAYARWYDFFARHHVKVHVAALNPDLTDVGITLALDALNGVSVAYQYSLSHSIHPSRFISAAEHVQFTFSSSPLCEGLWRAIQAPVERFVPTGFIYDNAFAAIRGQGRFTSARQELQDKGARFILCFFDENSRDDWESFGSHDAAAHDYECLMRWVLADPTLGVICKVKKSHDLDRRVRRVTSLIEQAERTGRCRLLLNPESDPKQLRLIDPMFPAEAAMMADLCIGKLSGITAAFEAQLVGVPALLVDTDRFSDHPLRTALAGKRIIFDDWASLKAAVERYRAAPEAHVGFGEWSPLLEELDPFRDGRAAERIAGCIRSLLDGVSAGLDRDTMLAGAAERYRTMWGGAKPDASRRTEVSVA